MAYLPEDTYRRGGSPISTMTITPRLVTGDSTIYRPTIFQVIIQAHQLTDTGPAGVTIQALQPTDIGATGAGTS